jgi:hypothetical protein
LITSMDDYLIHQTSEPIAQPEPTDRNFYDRYWMNGYDSEGGFLFECGMGVYPNRKVLDAHWSVSIDGVQHCFHGSRRAPGDRTQTRLGPLEIEVVEPMRALRVRLGPNETGIECDLTFTARTFPHLEPKNVMYDEGRCIMNTSRFTQLGRWEGFFSVAGERVDVRPETTFGTRDKSWGVRPVGEPEAGAPGLLTNEPGVYWVWAPTFWPDGFCTQFGTFEDRDGHATQVSGNRVPLYETKEAIPAEADSGIIDMASARHKIHWHKGTRLAERAEFELTQPDGEVLAFTLEPMIRFHLLALGYQHPEWGHAVWKGEEVIAGESWKLDEIDLLDYKHIHNHQVCRATMVDSNGGDRTGANLTGIATLETIAFGRHDPSGFESILDGAP